MCRRLRRCSCGWTGSTALGCRWPIGAWMTQCSRSFGPGWLSMAWRLVSWTCSWRGWSTRDCSSPGVSSVPIRRISLRRCGSSTRSNWLGRRSAPVWRPWPAPIPTGWLPGWMPAGSAAMGRGWIPGGCPPRRPSVPRWVSTTPATVSRCLPRSGTPRHRSCCASCLITSPYDTDARWGGKQDLTWNGYKLHVSESCDAQAPAGPVDRANYVPDAPPNLITNTATTDASVPDVAMTESVHIDLDRRGLLPGEHYVDSGYPSADLLVSSLTSFGVRLVTPMLADTSPQARAGAGFDRTGFTVDWDDQRVTCPNGKTNASWTPPPNAGPRSSS